MAKADVLAERREAHVTRAARAEEAVEGKPQTVRERYRLERGAYVLVKP